MSYSKKKINKYDYGVFENDIAIGRIDHEGKNWFADFFNGNSDTFSTLKDAMIYIETQNNKLKV